MTERRNQVSLVLKRLDGNLKSLEDLAVFLVPSSQDIATIDVLRRAEGPSIWFRTKDSTEAEEPSALLARIQCCAGTSFVLEPLVPDVAVGSARPSGLELDKEGEVFQPLPIPPTTEHQRSFLYLRPEDIVFFQSQGLAMHVNLGPAKKAAPVVDLNVDSPMADIGRAEVQVHSSDAEPDQPDRLEETRREHSSSDSDSETDDEADLDNIGGDTHLDELPAPHTPRCPDQGATVKETPNQPSAVEDEQPYSTAPMDYGDVSPPETPTDRIRKANQRSPQLVKNSSQSCMGTKLLDSIHQTPTSSAQKADSEAQNNTLTSTKISSGATHNRSPSSEEAKQDSLTKPPMDAKQPASLNGLYSSGSKRKISTEITEAEQDDSDSISSKRLRTLSPLPENSTHEGVKDAPQLRTVEKRRRPRNLSKAAQQDDICEDEIAVATESLPSTAKARKRTSSPRVVVSATGDKTPRSIASSPSSAKISKIILSRVNLDKAMEKWLKSKNVQICDGVPNSKSHFICVVAQGELKKTPKVLRSLIAGKCVVTEDWLEESRRADMFFDQNLFLHKDLRETHCGDRSKLFVGKTLLFTKTLAKQYHKAGWEEVTAIVKDAGAQVSKCDVTKHGPWKDESKDEEDAVVFFGCEKDDDAQKLINDYGRTVFHKDFLTHSILTGELDMQNEQFQLSMDPLPSKKRTRP